VQFACRSETSDQSGFFAPSDTDVTGGEKIPK
jgi:hypothetical protein